MEAASYLTIAEAAKALRVSEKTVRRRLDDGSLGGRQLGGKGKKWLIPATAVFGQPAESSEPEDGLAVVTEEAGAQRLTRGPVPRWKLQLAALRKPRN